MPIPLLAITYAFHLIATVTWLAGLIILVMASWPSLIADTDSTVTGISSILPVLERRIRPWGNVSLMVLLVTGMIQMGSDEHYRGLLLIDSPWSIGLLAKHAMIAGILITTGLLQWSIYPALERNRLLVERSTAQSEAEETCLRQQVRSLTLANVGLGLIVLVLTAVITAL